MFGNVLVQTKNRNNLFQYPFSSTNPLDNRQASKQPQIPIIKNKKNHIHPWVSTSQTLNT